MDDAQQRVVAPRIGLGEKCRHILRMRIVHHEIECFIGRIQQDDMRIGWPEIRIARLVSIPVDIDGRICKIPIFRPHDVLTIRETQLHLAERHAQRCSREPVAIFSVGVNMLIPAVLAASCNNIGYGFVDFSCA